MVAAIDTQSKPQNLLEAIWKYLPVFRSVAESESVTRAARGLGIGPPAVSRSIKHLEEVVGRPLFARKGRKLLLNPLGAELLAGLQKAQGTLSKAISRLSESEVAGLVRIGAMGQLDRMFLLPAMAVLNEQHPGLKTSIRHMSPEEAMTELTDGTLDVYLAFNTTVAAPLRSVHLAEIEVTVYAGAGHPLFDRDDVSLEEMQSFGFAAQRKPPLMRSVWPLEQNREVTLYTDSHTLALDACLAGTHLCVMERIMAARFVEEGRLRAIGPDLLEPVTLSLCTHERTAEDAVAEAVTRAVLGVVREALKHQS